jgi:hypothetical protein
MVGADAPVAYSASMNSYLSLTDAPLRRRVAGRDLTARLSKNRA